MEKNSFILYGDIYDAIKDLDNEDFAELFRAVFKYVNYGVAPTNKNIYIAFMFIKNLIDKNNEKWENTRQKRSEAGKKHKGNQYTKDNGTNGTSVPIMEQNGTNGTNGTDNVNVNVNVNDNVINNKKENIIKEKKKYGELETIKLTDEQLEKLKNKFPNDYLERIDRLSLYIASKGDKYKDHYATILNWSRKDDLIENKNLTQQEVPLIKIGKGAYKLG